MSEKIKIECPGCGQKASVAEEHVDRAIACPKCNTKSIWLKAEEKKTDAHEPVPNTQNKNKYPLAFKIATPLISLALLACAFIFFGYLISKDRMKNSEQIASENNDPNNNIEFKLNFSCALKEGNWYSYSKDLVLMTVTENTFHMLNVEGCSKFLSSGKVPAHEKFLVLKAISGEYGKFDYIIATTSNNFGTLAEFEIDGNKYYVGWHNGIKFANDDNLKNIKQEFVTLSQKNQDTLLANYKQFLVLIATKHKKDSSGLYELLF